MVKRILDQMKKPKHLKNIIFWFSLFTPHHPEKVTFHTVGIATTTRNVSDPGTRFGTVRQNPVVMTEVLLDR